MSRGLYGKRLDHCMISWILLGGTWSEQSVHASTDVRSLTQTFPSSSGESELQQRFQALVTLHNKTTAEVAAKESEIVDLTKRLTILAADSHNTAQALSKQVTELQTECRWAKEGRAAAERMERLAKQEIEAARAVSRDVKRPAECRDLQCLAPSQETNQAVSSR